VRAAAGLAESHEQGESGPTVTCHLYLLCKADSKCSLCAGHDTVLSRLCVSHISQPTRTT